MTVKTYTARDSATSALRKLGLQARDYNLFITKVGDKFECNLGAATKHLEDLKKPLKLHSHSKEQAKVAKEPRADRREADPAPDAKHKREGISATARALIADGKTNAEVWEVLQARFDLDKSKRHYPTWYRCEMKRTGLLPKDA
tara:strand:- start:54 stop:485 length:432 start_codon:yes stop_codon:yes gene_type:complete